MSADRGRDLPDEAYAAALASLPGVGPATIRGLLEDEPAPAAWRRVGTGPERVVAQVWERHARLGIAVMLPSHPAFPARLERDPDAPVLLFCLGDPGALRGAPTVALVGTRAPTRYGLGVAAQLGAELAAAGVGVVSGLALGIDGAAHEGACAAGAPPVAVVAGGLDTPYPQRNARLWRRVAARGVVVSESPAGVRTEKWRFPVRNRLLAALSDVVVVVESRHGGGSRHTVEAALRLGVPVGAVPGSIRSDASEGTNALLADGAFPVCSAADVLTALSLKSARVSVPAPTAMTATTATAASDSDTDAHSGTLSAADRIVYEALSPDPTALDELVALTGLALAPLCAGLERLARAGRARDLGGWWERL